MENPELEPSLPDMPEPSRRLPFTWQDVVVVIALLAVLLVGYSLRAVGENWDDFTHLHPDERFLTDVASSIGNSLLHYDPEVPATVEKRTVCTERYPRPSQESVQGLSDEERDYRLSRGGIGSYFDAECSDLNPVNVGHGLYVYGQFPLFTTRAVAETITEIERDQCEAQGEDNCNLFISQITNEGYNGIHFVGRRVSRIADTLSILVVFLIAFKLVGRWPALIAATLYAFAPFPIQQSHFWTVDAFTSLWVLLAIYAAVNVLDDDASRPAFYSPLMWIAAAFGLWIWEQPLQDEASLVPLVVYLASFFVVGVTATWAQRSRDIRWLFVSYLGPVLIVLADGINGMLNENSILTTEGAVVLLVLAAISAALIYWVGINDLMRFGGTLPWLMAAFGLWVFDALAHYPRPELSALVIYLVIFSVGALLSSVLYRSTSRRDSVSWIVLLGGALTVWAILAVLVDTVSTEGALVSLGIVAALATSTTYGYRDHATFGIAFGAAMAGRVNILPIVGLLILAVIIRAMPALDRNFSQILRYRLATRAVAGLVIAGVFSLVVFRFLQPHAFAGPSIFGIVLDDAWLGNVNEARDLVSGSEDIPPNHQWANRVPWLFPWQNMVLYGMGVGFGLIGWAGAAWALWRVVRGRPGWTRLILPAAWIAVYFGWLGGNWVTTMRYFLPIYGMVALFAGWLLVEMIQGGWRAYQRVCAMPSRRVSRLGYQLGLGFSTILLLLVMGYTAAYGMGMANMYRSVLTRVGATLWYQENVAGNIGVWVERDDGSFSLQNIATGLVASPAIIEHMETDDVFSQGLLISADAEVDTVILHRITDIDRDEGVEIIAVRLVRDRDPVGSEVVAEQTLEIDLNDALSHFGDEHILTFDDTVTLEYLPEGFGTPPSYRLELEVLDGNVALSRNVFDALLPASEYHLTLNMTDVLTQQPLAASMILDDPQATRPGSSFYMAGQRTNILYNATTDGVIRQIEIPHIADPLGDADEETFFVEIINATGDRSIGQARGNFLAVEDGHNHFGPSVLIELNQPIEVQAGEQFSVIASSDAPLETLGHVVATEGPWDDPIPYNVCPLPEGTELSRDTASGYTHPTCAAIGLFGQYYHGVELYLALEDDELKRVTMLNGLNEADYFTIASNRFYDSLSRNPDRWPMSVAFYEALFSGELGFELALEWSNYPNIGPFEWKDQVLPTDDLADWMNEYEAEEAFTVYDHPTVFVFRKTDAYDPEYTAEVLGTSTRQFKDAFGGFVRDLEPVNRNVLTAPQASDLPTGLMLTEADAEAQREGTLQDEFDRDSPFNQNQVLGVAVWWLAMIGMGWLTFPMLFAIFPALWDRGFAVAKLVGWLFVAWFAWVGAALHLGTWSRGGIVLGIVLLGLISLYLGYRKREELWVFVRSRWRHLLILELLTLGLFLAFVGVRLGNPDLWHNSFGGEKPMDFAYFNAVLRSEVFPPIDPWFAGGYINYYYWGFVLVGAPAKLLGIWPAIAYNVIIPTVFAWTAMGAFTIAYNVVAARRAADVSDDDGYDMRNIRLTPRANPWLAGILALILVAVAGNLDTPRVFFNAVAQVGGYEVEEDTTALERYNDLLEDFQRREGRNPDPEELRELQEEAENIPVSQEVRRGAQQSYNLISGFVDGVGEVLTGTPLEMHTHRWYWASTRIIAELPEDRGHNAINEMPYFTFLYGDLHAHMISLPMMLLAILWLLAEVLGAGRGLRTTFAAGVALFLGAMTIGMLQAVNTWDLPTFLILGVTGITFTAWVAQRRRIDAQTTASPIFQRLTAYMDWNKLRELWPLLAAVPIGMSVRAVLWLINDRIYEDRLLAGEIPAQCIGLTSDIQEVPEVCAGLLEPTISLFSILAWGIGALGLVVFLYMAAYVFWGTRFDRRATLAWIGRLGFFGVAAWVAVRPFSAWYAGEAGLETWQSDRTPLWAFLNIHGLFLFIMASFLVWRTARWLRSLRVEDLKGYSTPAVLVVAGVPLTLVAALLVGLFAVPVMLVTLPMMAVGVGLFLMPRTSNVERLVYVAMVLALGIATGVEIVRVNVDIGRQNTVFKFYMQVWLLLGLTSAVALAWMWQAIGRWRPSVRMIWQSVLALFFAIALIYPVMATQARWLDRFNASDTPITLDGMAYMPHAVYGENGVWFNFIGDYNMINWLLDEVEGSPTIIEAQTGEYHWGSRISINTGLPTVVGWNWHQRQQRSIYNLTNQVWNRSNNVAAFYTTPSIDAAWDLAQFYGIEYIIVGNLERIQYNDLRQTLAGTDPGVASGLSAGIAKFERMEELGLIETVYEEPTCVINQPISAEECDPAFIVMDRIYQVHLDAELPSAETARVNDYEATILVNGDVVEVMAEEPLKIGGFEATPTSLAWSPNGEELAIGLLNGGIEVWDIPNSELIYTLDYHQVPVEMMTWSDDGALLATGSTQEIYLWQVQAWREDWDTEFIPLISVSADETVTPVWNRDSQRIPLRLRSNLEGIQTLVWTAERQLSAEYDAGAPRVLWED